MNNQLKRVDMSLSEANKIFTLKDLGIAIHKNTSTVSKYIHSKRKIYVEIEYKITGWYEDMS